MLARQWRIDLDRQKRKQRDLMEMDKQRQASINLSRTSKPEAPASKGIGGGLVQKVTTVEGSVAQKVTNVARAGARAERELEHAGRCLVHTVDDTTGASAELLVAKDTMQKALLVTKM